MAKSSVRPSLIKALSKPSPLALASAVLLVLLEVLWLLHWASPDHLVQLDESRIQTDSMDTQGHVGAKVLRLRRQGAPKIPRLYVLGGSTMLAEVTTDREVSRELSQRLGREEEFINLATASQTILQSYMLAASVPKDSDTRFLIHININRLQQDCGGGRKDLFDIPFLWAYCRDEIEALPFVTRDMPPWITPESMFISRYVRRRFVDPTIQGIADIRNGAAAGPLLSGLLAGFVSPVTPYLQYSHVEPFPLQKKRELFVPRFKAEYVPSYYSNSRCNLEILGSLLNYLQEQGCKVALFLSPVSPLGQELSGSILDDIERRVADIGRRYGATVLDCTRSSEFVESDFKDFTHMSSSGILKSQDWLAKVLSDWISGEKNKKEPEDERRYHDTSQDVH